MRRRHFLLPLVLLFLGAGARPIELHVVPVPIQSYRLLAMSMDDGGFVWAGSIHRALHRYDPRIGSVETIKLPYDAVVCSCICAGEKVYITGQAYPKLIVYDRVRKTFKEVAYPSPKPDVWYGTELVDGRHLFLFDRQSVGVIRWDTVEEKGEVVPWPYPTPVPIGGRYEPRDKAVWCSVYDLTGGQYVPLGLARLDVATLKFTGYYPYPKDDAGLTAYEDPAPAFFVPITLKGKLVPFDFRKLRWCKFLDVPEYGKRFGFIGGATVHDGKWYFSISTYNGTDVGCDGKPYHFCNGLFEFDPAARTFAFPTLEAKDDYYQVAYTLSAGGQFFATGTNIREPDGTLDGARAGEVVFWQTAPPKGERDRR